MKAVLADRLPLAQANVLGDQSVLITPHKLAT